EGETIEPGQRAMVQLRLAQPVTVLRGDRFIVRRPSPSETIGGGIVLDANPRRHKRFDGAVLEQLQGMLRGSPEDLTLIAIGDGMQERSRVAGEIANTFGRETAEATIDHLIRQGTI